MKTKINANQKLALRAFAGLEKYTGQSNHYIAALKVCHKLGLISRRYEGIYVFEELTELGRNELNLLK